MADAASADAPSSRLAPKIAAQKRRDIERMCELNARVRLCKGAYKEPPEVAHQSMDVIREHFIEYMQRLLTGARYPGIATHDDRLINATNTTLDPQLYVAGGALSIAELFNASRKYTAFGVGTLGLLGPGGNATIEFTCTERGAPASLTNTVW